MVDFVNAAVQGGLLHRATQDYDEEQALRAHAARTRQFGVKQMELGERKMDAEGELLDQNTALQRLRQDIENLELQYKQKNLPAAQKLQTLSTEVATGEAEAAKNLQPSATALAGEAQNVATQNMKDQQAGNIWAMLKVGDKAGALEALNKSEMLYPGRKFSDIQLGQVPAIGADGKPIAGPDGKPVMQEMVQLVPADGGKPAFVPKEKFESSYATHGARYEKVGKDYIRIDRSGKVTPVYQPEEFAANTETGGVFSKRTGLSPAAGGVRPGGAQPGASAPSSKQTARVDTRVRQGTNVVNRYFGISDLSGLDPKVQPDYQAIVTKMAVKVRAGQDPEGAANEAINEVKREKALADTAGGGASYTGPTPWRR